MRQIRYRSRIDILVHLELYLPVVSTRSRLPALEGWCLSHLPAGLGLLRMSRKHSPAPLTDVA